jgi:integrase
MARTVRDSNLGSRSGRLSLTPRGKPYYRAIDPGLHVGYRKGRDGGVWVMRRYVGNGAYEVETIAVADDKADADGVAVLDFKQAQARIRELHVKRTRVSQGLPAEDGPYTVERCIAKYLDWLDRHRKSGRDARWRAEALIIPELGNVPCAELTAGGLRKWRDKIIDEAPRLRTRPGQTQQYRDIDQADDEALRRRKATANRTLTILKAALNAAWHDGTIPSDDAWRRVEPFKEADAARVRYLTTEEARRLINAAEGEFRDLIRAALATGCRFGELAALQVQDFNPDVGTLHIRNSKAGKDRHVVLNKEGVELFTRLAAGRAGVELMLRKADGGRWGKSNQARPMAEACGRAKIEPAANFHCLRHTYASLAIMGRKVPKTDGTEETIAAPLLVVARNLGHTDTRMVERHYGHLSANYIADEIRRAAPRFGIEDDSSVIPLSGGGHA